jgi:hypothetical protein
LYGRNDEAIGEARTALQLEPTFLQNNTCGGWNIFSAGQTERGLELMRRAVELDPNFALGSWGLGIVQIARGDLEDAIAWLEKTRVRPKPKKFCTVSMNALKPGGFHHFRWQLVHLGLDRTDSAFQLLDVAFKERDSWLSGIETQWKTFFTTVRSDPRYIALVRRVGLPDPDERPGQSFRLKLTSINKLTLTG